jgi:uncharacterized membrane protein YGL010W
MKTAAQWFEEYGESHQNPTNKAIHWVCVPVILFTTIGLFWSIPNGPIQNVLPGEWAVYSNWGTALILGALVFYFSMSRTIFIGMLGVSILSLWGNAELDRLLEMPLWQFSALLFFVAWAGQFWGHKIEGMKPSFLKDLQFLLVGPAWLLHFIYRRLGIPL